MTLKANTESYILAKKLSFFNREDSVFLSNQRPDKDTGTYFNKTQNLCFLGKLLKEYLFTILSKTDGYSKKSLSFWQVKENLVLHKYTTDIKVYFSLSQLNRPLLKINFENII